MSQEISLDLKQKLFEALQQSARQPGSVKVAESTETPETALSSPAQFQKLAEQIRGLEASNTDGIYNDFSEIPPPSQETLAFVSEGPTSLPSEELRPVEDLDILFPWSKPGETPPDDLQPAGTESEAVQEEMQWDLGTLDSENHQSLYELADALEPEEPTLLEDEIREASERLAKHLEEVERDLADLSGSTPSISYPEPAAAETGISAQVYDASTKYDYTALYDQPEPGPEETPMEAAENTPAQEGFSTQKVSAKTDFNATLSVRSSGSQPDRSQVGALPPPLSEPPQVAVNQDVQDVTLLETYPKGGNMADLSGYKDLSKAPMSLGDAKGEGATSVLSGPAPRLHEQSFSVTTETFLNETSGGNGVPAEVEGDVNSNFQTLIRLINELPEGVTKQTGAQIIRLTMESMGIFMEDVLSDAQAAQSEMLDAVRANIKKIEEYKTIIRKLETDIKYYQTKANELSEIIDLFILSNTSSKVPNVDEYTTR